MATLFILNDPPYGTELVYNGLRLAGNMLRMDEGHDLTVFLMGDAASAAKSGQITPNGYYNVNKMLGTVIRRGGKVLVCGTCMDARGLTQDDLIEGAVRSTLDELTAGHPGRGQGPDLLMDTRARQTVIVLGGGVGGVATANRLRRRLASEHRVVLVNKEPDFSFASSYLWVMSGDRRPDQVTRPLQRLARRGIEVVIGQVEHIDPAERTVTVDGMTLTADHLVVTLGADWVTDRVPGLTETGHTFATLPGAHELAGRLGRIDSGRIVVVTAAPLYKCPAAPYEAALLHRRRAPGPRGPRPGGAGRPQRRAGPDAGRRTGRRRGAARDPGRPGHRLPTRHPDHLGRAGSGHLRRGLRGR